MAQERNIHRLTDSEIRVVSAAEALMWAMVQIQLLSEEECGDLIELMDRKYRGKGITPGADQDVDLMVAFASNAWVNMNDEGGEKP